jgi:hypothetical protein
MLHFGREMFAGLAIDSLGWEWKKHPVIKIDLNAGRFEDGVSHLDARLSAALGNAAQAAGLDPRGSVVEEQFGNLIQDMHARFGQKVAVIIDEYDKPLLNTIDNPELYKKTRTALKAFYGVLKSSDEHLKFVLLTGVTKFAQVSVFSDLNHLTDISLDPVYWDICGITQEELEKEFDSEIQYVTQSQDRDRETYLAEIKRFYNGYRFSGKPATVYNPFGLLNHFNSGGAFRPYWFETGTPTFLIKLIEEQKIDIFKLEKKVISSQDFGKYDVENMRALPVLYQAGYLTIVDYNAKRDQYTLSFPNDEVRISFAGSLCGISFDKKKRNIGDWKTVGAE